MRARNLQLILPLILAVLGVPLIGASGKNVPAGPRIFPVIATSEVWGELAPCG